MTEDNAYKNSEGHDGTKMTCIRENVINAKILCLAGINL